MSITVLSSFTVSAKVTLPNIFTNNMVLQQKSSVPVWGTSNANQVTVITSWDDKKYVAIVADGKWQVDIKTPSYGGPFTMTFNDGDVLKLNNVLIGEVWLCSGQSNMEMPLEGWGKIKNYEQEIADANYPNIRLLQATHKTSAVPLNELSVDNDGWQVCSPQNIPDFSATAYFFARSVYKELKIPIGLIHSSWGGTVIEAWTSRGALSTIPDFKTELQTLEKLSSNQIEEDYQTKLKNWLTEVDNKDKGYLNKKAVWAQSIPTNSWGDIKIPSFWEKSVLPNFDGIVWFKKTFTVTKNATDKELKLHLGRVDDNDMVWINGKFIGKTDGFAIDRYYTIPRNRLHQGTNEITVRVTDTGGDGGLYSDDIAIHGENIAISLVGDWKYKVGINSKDVGRKPELVFNQNKPTMLFNAMIHPLLNLPIAGVIWYQGESNADRAKQYERLFPLMINDWRTQFKDRELPFLYVQLANFYGKDEKPTESAWAELRNAQFKTLTLPNTGMAVTIDIGEANDIHPKDKQDVGDRLAKIALAKVYMEKTPYSGPLYKSFQVRDHQIVIHFTHNKGLHTNNGKVLSGFAIAGKDKKFYWADAAISNGKVIVSSPKVKNPVAVRYAWSNNPDANLYNEANLPASPFKTDDWQGITTNK
ncbi:sialate O-acetylesterase [Zhouia sp. PK063]|uniref:sialate O-acetylesterase n=1 Tax=Zhouia sp. PK063 TaxID=3373602 RepID=UPI0037AC6BF0